MFGARVTGGNDELIAEVSGAQWTVREEVDEGRVNDGGCGGDEERE